MKDQIDLTDSFSISNNMNALREISQAYTSIAVWERPKNTEIKEWVRQFIKSDFQQIKIEATVKTFKQDFEKALFPYQHLHTSGFELLLDDVDYLLKEFATISQKNNFRILWAIIDNGMCRRFHTDANILRLLCTYEGPGTQWVKPDNINYDLPHCTGNEMIINMDDIQQAKPFDVVILKGALHPHNSQAVLHRSPPLEKDKEKRLLFRIDIVEDL